MFDKGFPEELFRSIAKKFNESYHCQVLVSYQSIHKIINEYGFSVEFVHQMCTKMHG